MDLLYPYFYLLQFIAGDSYMYLTDNGSNFNVIDFDNYSSIIGTAISGIVIGLKTCIMVFVFIWARASFPRIRYDQLMSYCWTVFFYNTVLTFSGTFSPISEVLKNCSI